MRKRANVFVKNILRLALTVSCCFAMNTSNAEDGTLTNIKNSATEYLSGSHSVYELSITENPNAIPIEISGKTYYFTPNSGDNIKLLNSLSNTGDKYLVETTADNALFSLSNGETTIYYTYDYSSLPQSVYTLTRVTESGTDTITKFEWDNAAGKFQPVNYRVDLIEKDFGYKDTATEQLYYKFEDRKFVESTKDDYDLVYNIDYDHIDYEQIEQVRDNSGDEIFTTKPLGDINTDIINQKGIYNHTTTGRAEIGNVTGNFVSNSGRSFSGYAYGGAINNYVYSGGSAKIGNVNGNFIGNHASGTEGGCGGAILSTNRAEIGNITGNFIGNYATGASMARGGAIMAGSGNDITGDFINNYAIGASADGGAIVVINSFKNITGDFIGNYVLGTDRAGGGAISTAASKGISNITSNFIGNSVETTGNSSETYGGAISNTAYLGQTIIGNITGDFIENSVNAVSGEAYGGAIYNYILDETAEAVIEKISANFERNSVTNLSGNAFGGAIYNTGKIKEISGNFIENKVIADQNAYGGAIYSTTDINIVANNDTTLFSGNYTQTSTGRNNNAIWMQTTGENTPTLTLKATNHGTIQFDDEIDGGYTQNGVFERKGYEYNLKIDGDSTSKVILNNSVINANAAVENTNLHIAENTFADKNSTLSVNSGNVNLANDKAENYQINQLTSNENANYSIDVDLSGMAPTPDTITAGENSSGTITISDINFVNSTPSDTLKFQVLNAQDDAIQLALSDNISGSSYNIGTTTQTLSDTVTSNTNFKDTFNTYTQSGTIYGSLGLATTNTTNDSIELAINNTVWNDDKVVSGSMGDTLKLVNQLETTENKNFNFDTATDKYDVTEDLGQTASGTFNINGVAENGNRSEINLNGHSGFELSNDTILNVNNTKITGNDTIITVSNENATVNLANANIDGDIKASENYTLNVDGSSVISGNAGKANTNLNGSEFQFGSDTLKEGSLNAQSGTVNLQDGKTTTYEIGTLTSDQNTNYKLDVDLSGENSSADKLSVGNNSTGTVKISSLNFVNSKTPENEFVVQLLDTENNNIQLELDNNVSGENYALGQVSETTYDEVKSNVNWQDKFNSHTKEGTNYGNMSLATTDTTNDSIALTITDTKWQVGEKTVSMGDTLALLNQLETTEDRNFNFDTASDVYEVSSDLGTTSEGTLNINGVLAPVPEGNSVRSTINGNNHSLFKLDNETTLNMNNVKITGANNVVTGNNKDAVVNINNSEISNNTEGIKTAGSVNISGNSVIANNGNGVEVTSADSVITLTSGEITLLDKLTGVAGAKLNVNNSTVNFAKKVSALDMIAEQANISVASDNLFDGNNMTVNSASNLNMTNNAVGTMHLNNLTLKDNLNMSVDVDLANKSMDRLTADSYNLGDNKVNVNQMNMLSDSKNVTTEVLFADENLRNNVTTSVNEVAYSPIYKYGVGYDQTTGNFTFTRSGGTSGNPSYENLNPAVMTGPVAAQLGGYVSMLDTYNNAFNNMDMRMLNPASVRLAQKQANRYAITEEADCVTYKVNETNSGGTWVRPFAAYDSVGLKNGPKVDSFSYGTFVGGDTGIHQFKNGGEGVLSAHVSYLGSHQSFNGNSIYQNGGNLGLTGTYYKGNFFTGLTVNAGASVTDASTRYGNEDFPMFMAGVANKTGYNFEFKDGRFIIQPSLLLSYTFINTFDYTNAAGVSINGDPLHALQISPNVRFALNTKNGWQPYLTAGMNWNIMNDSQFTANMATLPDLSMKPYVQYGLGIQKTINDNFTAYGQVLLRHGGRNGIAANAGLRYIFGHESKPQEDI